MFTHTCMLYSNSIDGGFYGATTTTIYLLVCGKLHDL